MKGQEAATSIVESDSYSRFVGWTALADAALAGGWAVIATTEFNHGNNFEATAAVIGSVVFAGLSIATHKLTSAETGQTE